jgi:hypothetical protein
MSLNGKSEQEQENQASSKLEKEMAPSGLPQPIMTPRKMESRTLGVQRYNKEPHPSQVAPETPGGKLIKSLERTIKDCTPHIRAPSSSPTKTQFLNRHSNLVDFTAIDIDERVVRMDSELEKLKNFMESTERNSASVKDELELSKKRSEHCLC